MADKKNNDDLFSDDAGRDVTSDSGLGNLPPLSDFDSQGGFGSDSGALPPLGSFDSGTPSDMGGLPAISDIDVETPNPTGGNIRATPAGFESPVRDTFSSGGSGFQDLAADSDFSPETPEIGPGPDSNMDTPMFDSAFGGADMGFGAAVDTPQPTQAMETPMFGGGGAPMGGGFDMAGFGGAGGRGGGFAGFDAGTPPPDFSPDTGVGGGGFTPVKGTTPAPEGGRGGSSGGKIAIAAIVALLIGLLLGPLVGGYVPLGPLNPTAAQLTAAQAQISQQEDTIRRLTQAQTTTGETFTPEQLQQMLNQRDQLQGEITQLEAQQATLAADIDTRQADLAVIEQDVADKNEEFITLQDQYEELENQTAIVQARQKGLIAEVERLTSQTGQLEDANARRIASKEALEHAIDRLYVQVKESMPLTPEKYAHTQRVSAVESLRGMVDDANWLTPELVNAYTEVYLMELEIAQAQEYFFAKVTVTDEFGNRDSKWAECLMRGNWAVFYRTFDGKNIGTFTNLSSSDTPTWGFKENLPIEVRREVENTIIANRTAGWQDKVAVLAEKELAEVEGSAFQRAFSSL